MYEVLAATVTCGHSLLAAACPATLTAAIATSTGACTCVFVWADVHVRQHKTKPHCLDRAPTPLTTQAGDISNLKAVSCCATCRFPRYTDAGLYLMDLKAAGKVKHISVTNMDTARLVKLHDAGVEVATNQVREADRWQEPGVVRVQ